MFSLLTSVTHASAVSEGRTGTATHARAHIYAQVHDSAPRTQSGMHARLHARTHHMHVPTSRSPNAQTHAHTHTQKPIIWMHVLCFDPKCDQIFSKKWAFSLLIVIIDSRWLSLCSHLFRSTLIDSIERGHWPSQVSHVIFILTGHVNYVKCQTRRLSSWAFLSSMFYQNVLHNYLSLVQ